jgi:transcriptional regulator with XRE-family HTH domain
MSLRALANKIGVSAPFLSDLEHNRRSTERLEDIAKALNVDPEELKRLDGRLTADLRDWISANPAMVALLKEMRSSNRSPQELRTALIRRRKK